VRCLAPPDNTGLVGVAGASPPLVVVVDVVVVVVVVGTEGGGELVRGLAGLVVVLLLVVLLVVLVLVVVVLVGVASHCVWLRACSSAGNGPTESGVVLVDPQSKSARTKSSRASSIASH
jgi:hypothetical protein